MFDYILKPLLQFLTKPLVALLMNLTELMNEFYESFKKKK
jgi:hypothetical protein